MKPIFENIEPKKGLASFVVYQYEADCFPFKWHFHPEYELTLITKGNGKRLVGDSFQPFTDYDLILIGPNLPHTWVSEPSDSKVSAIVVQFSEKCIAPILEYPENEPIGRLLVQSKFGLRFSLIASAELFTLIELLHSETSSNKFLILLTILDKLSKIEPQCLSTTEIQLTHQSVQTEIRINKICNFINENATTKAVSIENMAQMVHLTGGGFCKFFKKATGKTFSDYVNDIRVGIVTKLLIETDKSTDYSMAKLKNAKKIFHYCRKCRSCPPLAMNNILNPILLIPGIY